MKTQYEQETAMTREHRAAIDSLATDLLNIENEDTTRKQVADIVRAHGFIAFVGGHHVAIHHPDATIIEERLAMVTHEGADWK